MKLSAPHEPNGHLRLGKRFTLNQGNHASAPASRALPSQIELTFVYTAKYARGIVLESLRLIKLNGGIERMSFHP